MKPHYPEYNQDHGNVWTSARVRLSSRWRAYMAVLVVALAMFVLGVMLVWEVNNPPARVQSIQTDSSPVFPSGGIPSPATPTSLGLLFGKASLEEQRAAAKSALNRIIEGKLDYQTHEMFKQIPEYNQCRSCIQNCEETLKEAGDLPLQECRRNCMRTCSGHARSLMDGGL